MKIEELEKKAEEYAIESGYTKGKPDFWIVVQAYIAGHKQAIKENGVIWHDLTKNPNDLPEASIFNEVLNENGTKVFYDDINKVWNMFFNNYIVRAKTPKFWCKTPKIEVKE